MNKLLKKLQMTYEDSGDRLTYFHLFKFFIPLGTSTLLITISNMLLNRCLGYIPNSEFYISSLSVSRTLQFLFVSPVTIISLILTALTENRRSFIKITKYGFASIAIMQIWILVLSFSPISVFVFSSLYNLDGRLLENAVLSMKIISMLPVLFFTRDYFLGVAIKLRNTKFAILGSFSRAFLVLICSYSMPWFLKTFEPEYIPGIILFFMVLVESSIYALGVLLTTKGHIVSRMVHSLKRQNTYDEKSELSYKRIIIFALPLIFSYAMAQLLPSLTQSALALGENKEIILTVFAVSLSLLNIIAAFGMQVPQLVVNHDGFNPNNKNIIRKFCFLIVFFMSFILFLSAFTKFGDLLLLKILNVSQSNIQFAKLALKYGLLYPASMVFMGYKRGKLIKIKKTGPLIFERVIGTAISLILFLIIPAISWKHGAGAGILALTAANIATGLFTDIVFRINVKCSPSLITHSS